MWRSFRVFKYRPACLWSGHSAADHPWALRAVMLSPLLLCCRPYSATPPPVGLQTCIPTRCRPLCTCCGLAQVCWDPTVVCEVCFEGPQAVHSCIEYCEDLAGCIIQLLVCCLDVCFGASGLECMFPWGLPCHSSASCSAWGTATIWLAVHCSCGCSCSCTHPHTTCAAVSLSLAA